MLSIRCQLPVWSVVVFLLFFLESFSYFSSKFPGKRTIRVAEVESCF